MLYQTNNPHGGDCYGQRIRLDFSANTNPYGTPQGVLDAMRSNLAQIRQYPDPYCRELVNAISAFEGVPSEYVLCGNGAAELIFSYCLAVKPRKALELAPTFSEYSAALSMAGCPVDRFTLDPANDFALGENFLDHLCRTDADVVFLCNPNNPNGRLIDKPLLHGIIRVCHVRGIRLFLDECFLDLSDEWRDGSMKPCLSECPGLFILKAFTKSYGMAGVRLGYCMSADTGLLQAMSETVQPWNVSLLAQAAGIAALQERDFLARARKTIFTERVWLAGQLSELGLRVYPSHANYLLFWSPVELHTKLKNYGIAIRNCDNYCGLGTGWYRVAVRLHNENEQLISAIRDILVIGK